jgi:integrase
MSTMSSENRRSTEKRRRSYGRVHKRPNGSVIVQFVEPGAPRDKKGRRKYTTRTVASKKEGEEFLKELRRTILAGTYLRSAPEPEPVAQGLTVDQAIAQYIDAARAAAKSASTVRRYEANARAIAQSRIGKKPVAELTAADVEAYVAWRRERRWWVHRQIGNEYEAAPVVELRKGAVASPATVNRDLLLLKASLNRLKKLGAIEENPVGAIKPLREKKRKRAVLSREEANALLAACPEPLRLLVLAGLLTGARQGELLRLRWGDIDLSRKVISLFRPKTGSAAAIPLHATLAAELKRVKAERATIGRRIVADGEPVFLSRDGTPYRYPTSAWRFALKRAGLADREGLVFHSLRHSFATAYLEGGAAITDLQGLLGHQSVSTTQIYAGMVDKRARTSLEALGFGT